MSGPEALFVVGIIANVIQLVDFSVKVLERVDEYKKDVKDVPESFRVLQVELILLGNTLRRTETKLNHGEVDEETCEAIKPVMAACEGKLSKLQEILNEVMPKDGASKLELVWKALLSIRKEKEVEQISNSIAGFIRVLTLHYAESAGLSKTERKLITEAAKLTISGQKEPGQEMSKADASRGSGSEPPENKQKTSFTASKIRSEQTHLGRYGSTGFISAIWLHPNRPSRWLIPPKVSPFVPDPGPEVDVKFTGSFTGAHKVARNFPVAELPSLLTSDIDKSGELGIFFPESSRCIDPTWRDIETEPILITSERSRTIPGRPLALNKNESLASFFSRVYPAPLEVVLEQSPDDSSGLSKVVTFYQAGQPDLEISFQRTERVPEDGAVHSVPPSRGSFPLFDVADFEDTLSASMIEKGGFFLPMFDSEGLGATFSRTERRFAIRVYTGGINAVSGEPVDGTTSGFASGNSSGRPQDYVVVPEQSRLDGIAILPGRVSQFVATTVIPSQPEGNRVFKRLWKKYSQRQQSSHPAFSVEHQKTGGDEVGGMQLEVIPEIDLTPMYFSEYPYLSSNYANGWPVINPFERHDVDNRESKDIRLDPLRTPTELGLEEGQMLYMKNLDLMQPPRPKTVGDLLQKEIQTAVLEQQSSELELCCRLSEEDLNSYNYLYIATLTGRLHIIKISSWEKTQVYALNVTLETLSGIPRDQSILLWRDYVLRPELTLREYGIQPGDVIGLVLSLRGGGGSRLGFLHNGNIIHLEFDSRETVGEAKKVLAKKIGVPDNLFLLWLGRELLKDDGEVGDLPQGSSITVQVLQEEISEQALAVGGTIRQTIHKDTNDPRLWDHDNSTFINVQFLDGNKLSNVTGISLSSNQVIHRKGGSSRRPWRSSNSDWQGVSGNFEDVKTLGELKQDTTTTTQPHLSEKL